MTWPAASAILNPPPKGYDPLDAFPGVYIKTTGGNIGHIMDKRDPLTCPSFNVFIKKSVPELRSLLKKAIAKQKEVLVKDTDISAVAKLDKILQWESSLKDKEVESEFEKFKKEKKFTF